jgi:hypothetical protein
MHQFFATLFALLLSLCHHTGATRPLEAIEVSPADPPSTSMMLPDRYQLAHGAVVDASYSVSACLSCRQTNYTSTVR